MTNQKKKKVSREVERLSKLLSVNVKREDTTYKNMFIRKATDESVNDYVEKEAKKALKFKSIEDQLFDREMAEIDEKVMAEANEKKKGFSFEISDNHVDYPEVDELQKMIDKALENYRFLNKMG